MSSRFREIADWFEALTPLSLKSIDSVYDKLSSFRDPFNDIVGIDKIQAIYQHMFDQLVEPRFKVTRIVEQGLESFMAWEFTFQLSGKSYRIAGCTHFVIDPDTRLVIIHRDYWDAAQELYEKLPVLGWVLQRLRKRLSLFPDR